MTALTGEVREEAVPAVEGGVPATMRPGALRRVVSGRRGVWIARISLLFVILALWQWLATVGILRALIFSTPLDVFGTLVRMLSGQQVDAVVVYPDIWTTLTEMVAGYIVGSFVGVLLGVTLARGRSFGQVIEPFILAWYGVPIITIAPLLVLIFGIGFASKAATAFFATFFIVFFQTYSGVRSLKEEQFLLARLMGASSMDLLRRVLVPGSMPFIFVGLRQAVPVAMTGAIVGEFIASERGLGAFVLNASASFDPAAAFAGLVIVVAIVQLTGRVVSTAERAVIKWKPVRD